MAAQRDKSGNDRRNAFDIIARHIGWFLSAFYIIWALLTGLLSYARIVTAESPPLTWPEIAIISIIAAAVSVGIAFPLAFGIVEGTRMVLAEFRKRLWREEAREEGRVEGREEAREERDRLWEAWLERREAAERDGHPFTEPPPSQNGTHNESQ